MREAPLQRHDRKLLMTLPSGSRITRYDDGTVFGRVLVSRSDRDPYWLIMRDVGGSVVVDVKDLDGDTTGMLVIR